MLFHNNESVTFLINLAEQANSYIYIKKFIPEKTTKESVLVPNLLPTSIKGVLRLDSFMKYCVIKMEHMTCKLEIR